MSETQAQVWKSHTFSVEREASKTPGAAVLRFTGPFTARDMYSAMTPDALEKLFELPAASAETAPILVLDLAGVPYMDSMGLGMLVTQYVRLKGKGAHLIAAAIGPRVKQLLELTHLNTVIPSAATVEEALAG